MNGFHVTNVIIEGIILSLGLYLTCAWSIRNGAVNMVYLYSKEVQDRVIKQKLTTADKISLSGRRFKTVGLLVYFGYAILCVYGINGTRGFLPCFLEFASVLLIMGVFDRIVIDWFWVGHTKSWIIPGTEDLMPYITGKDHLKKWIVTIILYPACAAIICGILALVF